MKISFKLKKIIDFLVFSLVFYYIISHILNVTICLLDYNYNYNIPLNMVEKIIVNSEGDTRVDIYYHDNSWVDSIKTICVYTLGGFRYYLMRGGTPSQRGFVLASTVAIDISSSVIRNIINDPKYISEFSKNWSLTKNKDNLDINVTNDSKLLQMIEESKSKSNLSSDENIKKFLPEDINLEDLGLNLLTRVMDYLNPILQPVKVDYSNELLAQQIHVISILLFIMTIFLAILIFSLLFNMFIIIYSDKLLNYFSNKYILMYIKLQLKIIKIEIFIVGFIILYFIFNLIYALHFLATHPIIIS